MTTRPFPTDRPGRNAVSEHTESALPSRVYVIDDDPELCESVEWLLESAAISCVICHSADEFLEQ